MTWFLTALFLFLALHSSAQEVHVDTLIVAKGERFKDLQSDQLRFPVIKTGNDKIDSAINRDLKNRFTGNEYPNLPADSTLISWADDRIVYMGFEVTYLKNGLISLNISAEGCGAYCTGWTEHFTYSTTTGKYMAIDEIIDITGKLRQLVLADKDRQYDEQRKELKNISSDKESGVDEDTYQWVRTHYDECDSLFELKTFALYPDHLEIIEECYLPNAVKNLAPVIELKYKYADIRGHLKLNLD